MSLFGDGRTAFDKAKLKWAKQGGRYVVNTVRDDFLSGQALGRRSGTLVRSIDYDILPTQDGFNYGTNVNYGVAWELGFTRPAYTVRPVNARALMIPLDSGVIFRKYANIPAKSFEARPFLQPAGEKSIPYLTDLAEEVFTDALKEFIPDRIDFPIDFKF